MSVQWIVFTKNNIIVTVNIIALVQWKIKEQINIVVAVIYKKILIFFQQVLFKNLKCLLDDAHNGSTIEQPEHGQFYKSL